MLAVQYTVLAMLILFRLDIFVIRLAAQRVCFRLCQINRRIKRHDSLFRVFVDVFLKLLHTVIAGGILVAKKALTFNYAVISCVIIHVKQFKPRLATPDIHPRPFSTNEIPGAVRNRPYRDIIIANVCIGTGGISVRARCLSYSRAISMCHKSRNDWNTCANSKNKWSILKQRYLVVGIRSSVPMILEDPISVFRLERKMKYSWLIIRCPLFVSFA